LLTEKKKQMKKKRKSVTARRKGQLHLPHKERREGNFLLHFSSLQAVTEKGEKGEAFPSIKVIIKRRKGGEDHGGGPSLDLLPRIVPPRGEREKKGGGGEGGVAPLLCPAVTVE